MKIEDYESFSTEEELREYIGQPSELAVQKTIPFLDKYCSEFVERSPFVMIGTASVTGRADVSPRGDHSGFVRVLDKHTLFIPDRPGNKRLDTISNIMSNPNVGLLFLVPGFEDCLRVNGLAYIVKDDRLLKDSKVSGRTPKIGVLIRVQEAYLHCAKAIKRSHLWEEESLQDRAELPSIGQMVLEQTSQSTKHPTKKEISEVDKFIEDDYRNQMY